MERCLTRGITHKPLNIAFSNYFLRPAEVSGESIVVAGEAEELRSFEQLRALENQYRPDLIVFVSKKAYESFLRTAQKQQASGLLSKARSIPHPNTSWWNRPITQYEGRTGKEQLEKILQEA